MLKYDFTFASCVLAIVMTVLLIFQLTAVTAISMPPAPPALPGTDGSTISSNRIFQTKDPQGNIILTAKDSSGNILVESVVPSALSNNEKNALIGYFMGYIAALEPGPKLNGIIDSILRSVPSEGVGGLTVPGKVGFLEGVNDALKSMEMRSKLIKDTLEALGGIQLPTTN